MEWLHPSYSWALMCVPLVVWLFWHAMRRRRETHEALGHGALIDRLTPAASPRRRRWKATLTTGAVLLLALALIGPRYGTQLRQVERQGVDLIVALDVSHSMQAEDVAPSRLRRAKKEIKELLTRLNGDRVGLIIFAGDAFLQCPLTTDYAAVRQYLDVAEPNLIGTPGTDFGTAWANAEKAFRANTAGTENPRPRAAALLFVSDGENHERGLDIVTEEARERGVSVFVAGVGTTEGAAIPLYDDEGQRTGYKRDRQGRVVTTHLEEESLQNLAEGGGYFRIAPTQSTLQNLPSALQQMEQSSLGKEQFEEYNEQFQWPLALALLLLSIEPFIRSRRPTSSTTGA